MGHGVVKSSGECIMEAVIVAQFLAARPKLPDFSRRAAPQIVDTVRAEPVEAGPSFDKIRTNDSVVR